MRCRHCEFENPPGGRFCGGCGSPLAAVCPECGSDVPTGFRFCGSCGAALQEAAPPAAASPAAPAAAERRQLTVMFADLVDSTPLSECLDPEELRSVLRDYQAACSRVVSRYEGYVAKFLGDGVLAYFGYPQAHEDDAARSLHAGLDLLREVESISSRSQRDHGLPIRTRVGINTGLVVAGDMGSGGDLESMAIVGRTVNVAARLQEVAEPGSLVVSESTMRLVQGLFDCEALGEMTLKGVVEPQTVYRVLGSRTDRDRFDARTETGLTSLHGRAEEMDRLAAAWFASLAGQGRAVLLTGEAGIGKSRLARTLGERIRTEGVGETVELRCSPYFANTALYPVTQWLRRLVEAGGGGPGEVRASLAAEVARRGLPAEVGLPLAELLNLPGGEPPGPPNPELQKQRILDALTQLLLAAPGGRPLFVLVEDIHWADPTSLELLGRLRERLADRPALLLVTSRPGLAPAWEEGPGGEHLALSRLSSAEVERLVRELLGGVSLPRDLMDRVIERTDGIPLYVEEITRALVGSGQLVRTPAGYEPASPHLELRVPESLQDSLMGRLDRLGGVKSTAQIAAILGREFQLDLLEQVSGIPADRLRPDLSHLVELELIEEQRPGDGSGYRFRHALLQEAAYASVLRSTRQDYHRRVAVALTEHRPELSEVHPELLAHHYTEAGRSAEAIPLWHRAGEQALRRSANREAVAHLSRALDLLDGIPDGPERTGLELQLRMTMGPALIATRGFAGDEVRSVFRRALEASREFGDAPQLFPAVWGLFTYYMVRADLRTAGDLCEQLMRMASASGDRVMLLQAHAAVGARSLFSAEYEKCLENSRRAAELYDPDQDAQIAYRFGQDTGVVSRCYVGLALWMLGLPDQALTWMNDAVETARRAGHPFSLANALANAALLRVLRGEEEQARAHSAETLDLATEHLFPLWLAHARLNEGAAVTLEDEPEAGIDALVQGLQLWESTGATLAAAMYRVLLSAAYARVDPDHGLELLDRAEESMQRTGEIWWHSEALRIRGELVLRRNPPDRTSAGRLFRKSLAEAERTAARSPALRSALSLGRLLALQGKAPEAVKVVRPLLETFREGLDTADVRQAREALTSWQREIAAGS